jgi:uncharacterized membrane protein
MWWAKEGVMQAHPEQTDAGDVQTTNRRRWMVDRSDVLVALGVVLIGLSIWFLVGWAGVLAWCGFLLTAVGVAEARKVKR